MFAQDDHAALAGEFARRLGGLVEPLAPEVHRATAMHDCGWIDHDHNPTLNPAGQPTDVFEMNLPEALAIWRESSRRALAEGGDYIGLLVSAHSLALSAHAATKALAPPASGPPDFKMHFVVNKFQHAEVEQQETIRRRLGMRVDAPLTLGLALESIEPVEQQLIYDYRWLAAMDQLSLNLCCSTVMFPTLHHISPSPGGGELLLHVTRLDHSSACVRPWPFTVERVAATIPFRRMTAGHFTSEPAFRAAFTTAAVEVLEVELFPASPLAATA